MLYIKDDIIKDSNLITIETEDSIIYNPDHDTLLANGWEVYEEEPNTKIIKNKGFVKTTSEEFELLDKSVYEDSIIFIEDTKLIWNNDVYYCISDASNITYYNNNMNNVEEALDKLFNKVYFIPLQFNTFSPTNTQINEKGATPTITISWSFNKKPEHLYDGTNEIDVNTTTITKYPTVDTTYTIKGTYTDLDGITKEVPKSVSCKFYNRLFYKDITDRDITDGDVPKIPETTEEIQSLGVNGDITKTEWSVYTSKTGGWQENKIYQTGPYNGKKLCIAIPTSQSIKSMITSANDSILDQMEQTTVNYINGSVTTNYTIYTLNTSSNLEIDFIKITFN